MTNSLYIQFKGGHYTTLKLSDEDVVFMLQFLENFKYGEQGALATTNQNIKHYNRYYINMDDVSYVGFTQIADSKESQNA